MNTSVVLLNSYTAAKKAARYLSSVKIPARVEKVSGLKGGCAYGVRTAEEPEKGNRSKLSWFGRRQGERRRLNDIFR